MYLYLVYNLSTVKRTSVGSFNNKTSSLFVAEVRIDDQNNFQSSIFIRASLLHLHDCLIENFEIMGLKIISKDLLHSLY